MEVLSAKLLDAGIPRLQVFRTKPGCFAVSDRATGPSSQALDASKATRLVIVHRAVERIPALREFPLRHAALIIDQVVVQLDAETRGREIVG